MLLKDIECLKYDILKSNDINMKNKGLMYMKIQDIRKDIEDLKPRKYSLLQTGNSKLLLFNMRYKYTNCIYIEIDRNGQNINIKKDRVFDNKYLYVGIERMMLEQRQCKSDEEFIEFLKRII